MTPAWTIRVANPEDGAAIARIYAPYVRDTAISFEAEPPTPAEMTARVVRTLERFPWLVLEEEGEILGYAYATEHRARHAYRWCCEVSVYLEGQARGRGLGRALYARLLPELRALGLLNAYAGVTLPNPASVALHEALGFVPIGVYPAIGFKQGRFWDVGWWVLRLAQPAGQPAEPRHFGQTRP